MIPPNTLLRTPETYARYLARSKDNGAQCFMCGNDDNALVVFNYWKIIENDFPYDGVCDQNVMLVPLRHVAVEKDLTLAEYNELLWIKEYEITEYDTIMLNFPKAQTHPSHLHYHLLTFRRV